MTTSSRTSTARRCSSGRRLRTTRGRGGSRRSPDRPELVGLPPVRTAWVERRPPTVADDGRAGVGPRRPHGRDAFTGVEEVAPRHHVRRARRFLRPRGSATVHGRGRPAGHAPLRSPRPGARRVAVRRARRQPRGLRPHRRSSRRSWCASSRPKRRCDRWGGQGCAAANHLGSLLTRPANRYADALPTSNCRRWWRRSPPGGVKPTAPPRSENAAAAADEFETLTDLQQEVLAVANGYAAPVSSRVSPSQTSRAKLRSR